MDRQYYKHKLFSYLGEDMVTHLKNSNAIIAGGAIRSLICDEEIKDIDTYFRSQNDLINFMNEERIKSSTHIKSVTKRSITFSKDKLICQLIFFSYYSSPEEIFKDYDFTVCMGAYDFKIDDFVFHEDFFVDNATKKISINKGTKYPLISMFRLFKYKQKGYDFPQKQLLELAKAINKFDYNNEEVVKDQTQGFYGIVDDEKPLKWETETLEYFISDKIEYFESDNKKINSITLDEIPSCVFEQFKDKMVKVEFKPIIVYKYVKRESEGVWSSFYDSNFKYYVNEIATPRNIDRYGAGIYFTYKKNDKYTTCANHKDAVQIALRIDDYKDITGIDKNYSKKVFVLGEVDKDGNIITVNNEEMEEVF